MELKEAEKLINDCLKRSQELLAANNLDMAEMVLDQVLRCSHNNPDALQLLGLVRHRQGRYKEGIDLFDLALESDPTNAETYNNKALCQSCLGDIRSAIGSLQEAIRLKPDSPVFWNNIGLQKRQDHDVPGAIESFEKSLQLQCEPQTLSNLGGLYGEDHRPAEARDCFLRALEIDPEMKYAHEGLAYVYHFLGEKRKAWEEYEHRINFFPQLALYRARYNPSKKWKRGDDLWGKTVILYCEQGIGDAINFIRFVRNIKEQFKCKIIVHCSEPLGSLFRSSELGIDEFYTKSIFFSDDIPDHDLHACLMSLPYLLEIDAPEAIADAIFTNFAYIKTSKTASLPEDPGKMKIGICWAGSPSHPNDSRRSIPLKCFEPVYRREGVSLYSLQQDVNPRAYRYHPETIDLAAGCEDWEMKDCRPWMTDLEATAAIIEQMDVIITADTSILHLAGALGKSTHALIPYNPDWRWGLHGALSHWYPSVWLWRQKKSGNWREVISCLAHDIRVENFTQRS